MPERDLICIGCPMGCSLQVTVKNGKMQNVHGNVCGRGQAYAKNEVEDPRRMVTSLIAVEGVSEPLSVRTSEAIPKDKIFACLNAIRRATVKLPVQIGDVVLADVLGTGADIIATKPLPAAAGDCAVAADDA